MLTKGMSLSRARRQEAYCMSHTFADLQGADQLWSLATGLDYKKDPFLSSSSGAFRVFVDDEESMFSSFASPVRSVTQLNEAESSQI